ncbi:MAG: serine hydrolase [Candidatus Binatia bacterium]
MRDLFRLSIPGILWVLLLAFPAGAATPEGPIGAGAVAAAAPSATVPDPSVARAYLATIRPSAELQGDLDRIVAEIGRSDPKLLASSPRIAVIDVTAQGGPRLAEVRGQDSVYPASVVKFVYLMAAYAWQERGLLTIDAALDADLSSMIHQSSNQATRKVFARLTGTEPGPELDEAAYADFRERRLAVKRWLESMGIDDLHTVNPTYDGNGDLFGRDQQFLRDRSVSGGLPATGTQYPNRQAMTAAGTARLLALLANDLALTPEDSATVRRRMRRDVREQPHLAHRIAGGAADLAGSEVYAKSGTWGPIYADAGIVRGTGGKQFAIAVFTDASPPYRGDAIARLTRRLAARLLTVSPAAEGEI